jgi:uncharacterized membrane-anchored protein YjiN (DUF445 family)
MVTPSGIGPGECLTVAQFMLHCNINDALHKTVIRREKAMPAQPLAAAVGKDLQFIRFNGAMVGGLAGLALYSGEMLLRFV